MTNPATITVEIVKERFLAFAEKLKKAKHTHLIPVCIT
jgi:hypothetical protein